MFLKSKTDSEPQAAPANGTVRTAAPAAPSFISANMQIAGNVQTEGEVQLDGMMQGDLTCGSLSMGEQGALRGSVTADRIVIRGRIEGTIRSRSVRLEKTAKVMGDVIHETIAIEAGAMVEGKFIHMSNAARPAPRATRTPAPPVVVEAAPAPAAPAVQTQEDPAATAATAATTSAAVPPAQQTLNIN